VTGKYSGGNDIGFDTKDGQNGKGYCKRAPAETGDIMYRCNFSLSVFLLSVHVFLSNANRIWKLYNKICGETISRQIQAKFVLTKIKYGANINRSL
jgi:hypothetical protein